MPLARQHALSLTEVGCSYFAAKYRSVPKSLGVPEPGQVKLVLKSEYVNSRGMKKKVLKYLSLSVLFYLEDT